MANYRTHVTVGAGAGAIASGIGMTLAPGIEWHVFALGTFLGFIGGTVPDLDHDHGRGLTKIMALLSTFLPVIGFGSWFESGTRWTGIILLILLPCHYLLHWALPMTPVFAPKKGSNARLRNAIQAIFVASICSIPVLFIFQEPTFGRLYLWLYLIAAGTVVQLLVPLLRWVTVHRGVWHTVPVTIIYAQLMYLFLSDFSPKSRLIMAGAAFMGALSHLILDEIYSVDFNGMRIKRSFGTALKLWDRKAPMWSGFVYLSMTVLGVACFVL